MERADRAADAADVHVAMPRLVGLPAYARPPRPTETAVRLPDPDDLPLEAYRTEDVLVALGDELDWIESDRAP